MNSKKERVVHEMLGPDENYQEDETIGGNATSADDNQHEAASTT